MDKPPVKINELRKYHRYYDSPDGCDIYTKTLVTSRYGAVTGIIFSTYDVLMYSHAVGFMPIIKRYMVHTVPLTLIGATFALVANGVQNARNKDDVYNYFIGGMACGPILAAYLGSNHAILAGGLALGIVGVVKKRAIECGFTLFPAIPQMGTVRSWRNDYTVVKDPLDALVRRSLGAGALPGRRFLRLAAIAPCDRCFQSAAVPLCITLGVRPAKRRLSYTVQLRHSCGKAK